LEIGTILRLSERSGLVSVMNAKILCEEYGALSSFVHDHEDLIFAERITPGMRVFEKPKQISIGQNKGQEILRTNNDKRHSNRQEEILSLFSKKDRISIKDAVSAIDGCSEKTIQREIMALVEEGVLIKEGERRWSTYRKVQTA
jgi:predicted HTH transcriptional regulator